MDEAERKAWSDLGFDPDEVQRSQGQHVELARRSWSALWATAPDTDPWADRRSLTGEPFHSPFPLEVAGEPELDPLVFTVGLARPATSLELDALTAMIAELGREESRDDDDHVSYWSPVTARRTPDAGDAVEWWLDAATASPRTVRRIVEKTVAGLIVLGIPATFLRVGQLRD